MLFRSLSCLGWPCSDFIYHAVVSGVREQPGGGAQCPRIPSGDCPGHPELCPGDRAKRAVRRPSVSQGSTEFQAWTAPSHHHRAHLVRTWYIPALSPPREAHRDATDSTSGRRPETMLDRLPPPRPLAPLPPRSGRDRHRLPHLIRIRMVPFVHIQVLHRSVHLPRWFMDLVNFYKNSLLPLATHILNRSRHGHRVN